MTKSCASCPYKTGAVKFEVSPCPTCKFNGSRTFDLLTKGKQSGRVTVAPNRTKKGRVGV